MLTVARTRRPRSRDAVLLVMLLIPVVLNGCITVRNEGASPSPAADPSAVITLGSPTPLPLVTPTPVPTPEPTPEPVAAEVVAFMPNWLIDDIGETIDTDLVTIAAFHSIEASGAGRLVSKKPSGSVPPGWETLQSEAFAGLKEWLQSEGVKVVPVIQRVGWTDGTRQRTINLLSNTKARRALADRIARFVDQRGFDGVNLDIEPLPEQVAGQYVEFVREVRAALDEVDPELHLSIDVVPNLENYDLAALTADDAAELAVIMGYGYRTGASGVVGSVAPLRDTSPNGDLVRSVEGALAQVPPEKLVLALPWYGLAWSTESDDPGAPVRRGKGIDGPAETTYAAAVGLAAEAGRRYEPDQAAAWTAYPARQCSTCPATWRQVWYDDPESFGAKVDHALGQGLAGIGVWAAGMDDGRGEMWRALRYRLRPSNDETPPSGTPNLDPESVQGDLDGRPVVEGSAPLRLFATDGTEGSGIALARIGLEDEVDENGRLVTGRTYPAVERLDFPLGDPETGGSDEEGPRTIYVQWRDLAGNWSTPIIIETHVVAPATSATPSDLQD